MAARGEPAPAMNRKGLSGQALRTLFRIAGPWDLAVAAQPTLPGMTARATFLKWKNDPNTALPRDRLARLSSILGVDQALQILRPGEAAAEAWVKQPNHAPAVSGKSARDRMPSGQVADLFVVRQSLPARRAGRA
jgi:hypothetical protein